MPDGEETWKYPHLANAGHPSPWYTPHSTLWPHTHCITLETDITQSESLKSTRLKLIDLKIFQGSHCINSTGYTFWHHFYKCSSQQYTHSNDKVAPSNKINIMAAICGRIHQTPAHCVSILLSFSSSLNLSHTQCQDRWEMGHEELFFYFSGLPRCWFRIKVFSILGPDSRRIDVRYYSPSNVMASHKHYPVA